MLSQLAHPDGFVRNLVVAANLLIVIWTTSGLVQAATLGVPSEYATIQAALSVTQTGDTVRVSPGVYHEFLVAPAHSLTLTGWYSADTLAELRTVLDPIPGGSDTPSVAVFLGDTVHIENFVFYNRPEMRQPDWPTRVGGVHHTGSALHLRNCVFDSVSQAVLAAQLIEAEHCRFNGCLWFCLYPSAFGTVRVNKCEFSGSGWWLIFCSTGSTVRNSSFRRDTDGGTHLLQLHGSDIEVSTCRFGPSGRGFSLVNINPVSNCRIDSNTFEDIGRCPALLEVAMGCPSEDGSPISIRGNIFDNYQGEGIASGPSAIKFICQDPQPGYFGQVYGNKFVGGTTTGGAAPGIEISGSVDLVDNKFIDLQPATSPDVRALSTPLDTVFARDNQFLPPGIAAFSAGPYFDARENWWGDSTGPYHAAFNPEGQGTEVGNGVEFIPWLTVPPDSIPDTSGTNVGERIELPIELSLSVFPNPFNATTTLTIHVPEPGEYRVTLFDLHGRLVKLLYTGRIQSIKTLPISADNVASGTYFAKLSSPTTHVVTKLLLLK